MINIRSEEGRPRITGAVVSGVCGSLGLWFVMRPYRGLLHDSRIYVGRALADMNPTDLGRELMFAHDGQSGFSIFGQILRPIIEHAGVGSAAIGVTAIGLLIWLAAATTLFSRLLRGRALWSAPLGLALITSNYGGYRVFGFAESFATPRIFSEAAAMFALALMLDRRRLLSALFLLIAAAIHPIMAFPAAGVWLLMLVAEDRRWLALAAIGAAAVLGGAVFGLPVASRLFTPIDDAWLSILRDHSPYLFPALWKPYDVVLLLLQAGVLSLAAVTVVPGRTRLFLAASIVIVAAGLALAAAFPTLLIVQAQTWRAQWLLAVLVAGLFPSLMVELMALDTRGSATAGFLVAAVLGLEYLPVAAVACACALGARFLQRPPGIALVRTAAWTAAGCVLVWVLLVKGGMAVRVLTSSDLPIEILRGLVSAMVAALLLPLVIAWVRWGGPVRLAANEAAILSLGMGLLVFGFLAWDIRTDYELAREEGRGGRALREHLPRGELLWLDGEVNNYMWTRRPQWWSELQVGPAVFDRQLAVEYERRRRVLVMAGVQPRDLKFGDKEEKRVADVTPYGLSVICGDSAPPNAVIAPLVRVAPSLRPSAAAIWSAPAKPARGTGPGEQTFVVFDCNGHNT